VGKLPPGRAGRAKAVFGEDDIASGIVSNGGVTTQPAAGGAIVVPNCPVELTVLYNGQPAPATPDGSGNVRMNQTPPENTVLSFQLKNTGPEPVAVVLTIDGRNTVGLNPTERYDQNSNRESYRKWVLAPNQLYTIDGQLTDDKNTTWAKLVVDNEGSSAARFATMRPEVAGKIELLVFPANTAVVPDISGDPAGNGNGTVPTNGEVPADPAAQNDQATDLSNFEVVDPAIGSTKSAAKAKSLVAAATKVTVAAKGQIKSIGSKPPAKGKAKGLAMENGPAQTVGGEVKVQAFEPAAKPSANIVVTYYSPEMAGGSLGGLPPGGN
jgi:hypothetical protein